MPALDDQQKLTVQVIDELRSDGAHLDVHKSSAARDRIADRPDTRRSSISAARPPGTQTPAIRRLHTPSHAPLALARIVQGNRPAETDSAR
jgi:hypothetical protein